MCTQKVTGSLFITRTELPFSSYPNKFISQMFVDLVCD